MTPGKGGLAMSPVACDFTSLLPIDSVDWDKSACVSPKTELYQSGCFVRREVHEETEPRLGMVAVQKRSQEH